MAWRIRQGGYPDLPAAALAKAWSWIESYEGLLGPDVLARQLDPDRLDSNAALWAAAMDDGGSVWVVEGDHGEIVGVAQAGLGRDDDAPTPLELVTIYLRTIAQGTGVADALLQMAIGDAPAYLWVLSGNLRAQAFYRRHGFAPDGSTVLIEGLGITEERWVRRGPGDDPGLGVSV